tara:strand:- start:1480 stop:2466 length:987 start_codon:yes stop_codon:yes gene_type:complete
MIYKSYLAEQNINILNNNLLLFYGENQGLKDDFKKKIKHINPKANIIKFSQDEVLKNENNFYNELLNTSLFDEEKIFYINGVNDKILNLVENLIQKTNNQKIYLFAEILDKKSKIRSSFEKSKNLGIIACYKDNEISLKKIITNQLKDFTGLTTENLNLIIENSNMDRSKLNNELEKIKIFFDKKEITSTELYKLLNQSENDDFNILKDAALNGENNKTNKFLSNTLIENEKIILYLNLINQRLNKLNEILLTDNKSIEQAISSIKPPIFWKDKSNIIEQSKKWNLKKIKRALNHTFKLEIRLKSNSILDKNILLKKLLIDICNLANA